MHELTDKQVAMLSDMTTGVAKAIVGVLDGFAKKHDVDSFSAQLIFSKALLINSVYAAFRAVDAPKDEADAVIRQLSRRLFYETSRYCDK